MHSSNTMHQICQFSTQFNAHPFASELSDQVRRAMIDTLAVGIAARDEPASQIALRYAQSISNGPFADAWGIGHKLSAEAACLYNGFAAHVLDYDDVNSPLRGHPSIALLPPLLALAQVHHLSFSQLVAAYTVGFEVMVRMAKCLVQNHYAKGWHATTTLGTIGAALACSRLLALSETQTQHALGLAIAQAGGTRGNFGTMAKSFQTGQCGSAGIRATELARLGMDSSDDVLDGEQGFTKLYGEHESLTESFRDLGQVEPELLTSGIEIKKYPMCYAAHRSLDGMLALVREHQLNPDDVDRIHVTSNHRGLVPLIHAHPQTGLEAKFSMEFAMAAALIDRSIGLLSYTDASVQRTAIQALMLKVTKSEDDGPATPRWNRIDITLKNGQTLSKTVTLLRGSMQDPLTDQELKNKWEDCLHFANLSDDRHFYDTLMSADDINIATLMQRLPTAMPTSSH